MIGHPDSTARIPYCRDVDGLRNVPELVLEFISRRDYIGVYLGGVGFWCLWLAYRGLGLGGTKGFGWLAPDAVGEAAASTGRAWLAIGATLMAAGIGFWFAA